MSYDTFKKPCSPVCLGASSGGIARFEFGKCLQIGYRVGISILLKPKGLEGAQNLTPAPQDKVPDRPLVVVAPPVVVPARWWLRRVCVRTAMT